MSEDENFTPEVKYNPQDESQPLNRAGNPNTTGVNKRVVMALMISVAAVAVIALSSLAENPQSENKQEKPKEAPPHVGESINGLPNSYAEIPPPAKKLGPARPSELAEAQIKHERGDSAPSSPSELEKAQAEANAQKLKEASEAARAKLKFSVMENMGTPRNVVNPAQNAELIKDLLKQNNSKEAEGGGFLKQVDLARDADNRQDDKADFANKKRSSDPYLKQDVITPKKPYFVASGSIIPGVMLTGINSDLPGTLTGQVSQNVFDTPTGKYLLIPQGTKIIGEYNSSVTYGQERVQVIWTRLLFPSGKSISLEGMPGTDLSGYSGLSDQVNNHYFKLLGGVILSSILGATGQIAQGSTSQLEPTFGQLATQGAAQNLNNVGQKMTEKNLNIQPTLEIRQGMRFNIMVVHDIELPPYES